MLRCLKYGMLGLAGVTLFAGCDDFDEGEASLQISERICEEWPYGCTDSTVVVIERVNETRNGRQVEFRIVDRLDETGRLSAAYFEREDEEWDLLLFEDPFDDALKVQAGKFAEDSRTYSDALMELKAAQRWFVTIYDRYAQSLQELDSVSYKVPEFPLEMRVGEESWRAQIAGDYARCEFDISSQQLPSCVAVPADGAGTPSGPLSSAFGGEN